MRTGDIQTIKLTKNPSGSFEKIWEKEWLMHMGFTEKELKDKDEIEIVCKADVSDRKKLPFCGFGKPESKR